MARFAEGTVSTIPTKGVELLTRVLKTDAEALAIGDAEAELRQWSANAVATFQRELRIFLRQMVTLSSADGAGLLPEVRLQRISFAPRFSKKHVLLTVDGAARDVLWFQIIGLMRSAGVERFRVCVCGRLYAKTGRAEFCSTRCQKRIYMKNRRHEERRERNERSKQKGKGNAKTSRTR